MNIDAWMNAEGLMRIGGIVAFLFTAYWVRSRTLSEKYAVMWFLVAVVLLVCGIFPNLIMAFARSVRLAYSSAVLFISLGAIYLFAFSVSVALTRQQRRNLRLTQELGILEERVRALEARAARPPDAA